MFKRRVMVIDDSVVARRAIAQAINGTEDLEVAASAATGKIALAKLPRIQPDLVLLDVEMPEMDGLQVLAAIREVYPSLPVIMFSALTGRGAKITLDALALGANDYATKPSAAGGPMEVQLAHDLFPKIRALCNPQRSPNTLDIPEGTAAVPTGPRLHERPKVLVIGASTGGPTALADVIGGLPADFPLPVLLVQHMPAVFTRMLSERLNDRSALRVKEAVDGEAIRPRFVYIAPGDFHLTAEFGGEVAVTRLHQGPPENSCRPSVDVLFRSVASVYGAKTLAVMLTGMGRDGLSGCQALYEAGAQILCQDEASSVVWGMPGYVAKANLADAVISLDRLAEQIAARAQGPSRSAPNSTEAPWS